MQISELIRLSIFFYFAAYFVLAFGLRSYLVYRHTGRNPIVLARDDSVEGYTGRAFRVVVVACAIAATLPILGASAWMGELARLPVLSAVGWLLLLASMTLLLISQAQMGASWRVGVDPERTALVTRGVFARSRNPIFLSMRITLLGFCLVLPTALTFALLAAGEILIQIQVRIEERHLALLHGDTYTAYCARVGRWW